MIEKRKGLFPLNDFIFFRAKGTWGGVGYAETPQSPSIGGEEEWR